MAPDSPDSPVDAIVATVATETSITTEEILSRSHLRDIVKARHEVWRRVRADLGWSYPMIGKRFGVDHSTVQAALNGRRAGRGEKRQVSVSFASQESA